MEWIEIGEGCPDGCKMTETGDGGWYCSSHDFTSRIEPCE